MAGTQRLLATVMAFSLMGISAQGRSDVLGVVAQANRASLGFGAVAEGTTVYDGDRLTTGADGSLQLLVGDAMLYLADQSSAVVRSHPSGAKKEFQAELLSGAAVLSLTAKTAGEILVTSASLRPLAETRGVLRVQIVGPHELIVSAQRGSAQISYEGESEIIGEGKSYRVLLSPADDQSGNPAPKKPQKRHKAILLIALGAGAVAIATAIPLLTGGSSGGANKGVESPDRP